MGYKVLASGTVQRTKFPKKLSKAQIRQIEHAKTNTEAITKALKATAKINFVGRVTLA